MKIPSSQQHTCALHHERMIITTVSNSGSEIAKRKTKIVPLFCTDVYTCTVLTQCERKHQVMQYISIIESGRALRLVVCVALAQYPVFLLATTDDEGQLTGSKQYREQSRESDTSAHMYFHQGRQTVQRHQRVLPSRQKDRTAAYHACEASQSYNIP